MESILNSFLLVAAAEMGDKTQLLAFVLASRFKKPWTVFAGIFVATIFNHILASSVGNIVAEMIPQNALKIILGIIFIGFSLWILFPDKNDNSEKQPLFGVFLTTVIIFFLAEMGDKTQLATLALGAKFQQPLAVTIGSTLGMMVADGLAIVFSEKLTKIFPMKTIRIVSSFLFLIFGVAIYFRWV